MKHYILAIFSAAALVIGTSGFAADPPTTQPTTRSFDQIKADLATTNDKFKQLVQGGQGIQTKAARAKITGEMLPLLQKTVDLFNELGAVQPDAKDEITMVLPQIKTFQLIFDDPTVTEEAAKAAAGTGADAGTAMAERAMADYVKADGDSAGEIKAIDAFSAALKASPDNAPAENLLAMYQIGDKPSADVMQHIVSAVKANIKGPQGQQMAQEMSADLKVQALENKALTIKAVKLDGTEFNSADWKGKVVMVDFWATWCGPCIEELPRVKQIYLQYHSKGLEIVGVSCDDKGEELKKFLASNPDMPWPQLFDEKTPGWHPLATSYGVLSIPRMFLIDKKGIVRTVDGRENMEALIPQLLAE